MLKSLVALFVLSSASVHAAENAFDLKMDLMVDGQRVSSPRMIVKEGEEGSITHQIKGETHFIDVVASESRIANGKKGILMKLVVGKVDKEGKRIVHSTPQILAMPKHRAEIQVGDEHNSEAYSLSVLGQKTELSDFTGNM